MPRITIPLTSRVPRTGEATVILTFDRRDNLGARNEAFRQLLFRFVNNGKGTDVVLLKEGFTPVPLSAASDKDVVFCDALRITGTLR